mmetsp:Transcript_4565/g.5816  ORF Transcript_4565/g.5816 Transcript_4565/m.5816 type:complete len:83 (+) Transcript_4565:242-490(+)
MLLPIIEDDVARDRSRSTAECFLIDALDKSVDFLATPSTLSDQRRGASLSGASVESRIIFRNAQKYDLPGFSIIFRLTIGRA